jgi:hypothetical protein
MIWFGGFDLARRAAQAGAHGRERSGRRQGMVTCEDFAHIEVTVGSAGRSTVAKNWLVTPANWISSSAGLLTMDLAELNQPPLKVPPSVKWMLAVLAPEEPGLLGNSA